MNSNNFTQYDDNTSDWHYPYAGYEYDQPVNMSLANEATDQILNGENDLCQLINKHRTSDFYIDEFTLYIDFDENFLEISIDKLDEISEYLTDAIHSTNWMSRYHFINQLLDGAIEELLKESTLPEVINMLIDCYISCDFELKQSELEDYFEDYEEAKELISKRLLWEELKK